MLLAVAFMVAGVLHFVAPGYFIAIVPRWLPRPDLLVAASGVLEIAGGAGLMVRRSRRIAGAGLIALLVAVFPANIQMLQDWRASGGGGWYEIGLWVRLPLQALFIWMVHRVALRPDEASAEAGRR
ncbi:MAG: DoxX family protein [Gemmatimonadales bacterium]